MAATKEDIVNRALRLLASPKITDIDSTIDQNAIIMKDFYDDSLKTVLSATSWMFATKRADLVIASGETNAWTTFDLNYIYTVPSDFIRVVGTSDPTAVIRQEGLLFLTDRDDLGLLYVYFNETIAEYPAHFIEAFADKLAADACFMITGSKTTTKELKGYYIDYSIKKAKAIDSQGETKQSPRADEWINAKYSGPQRSGNQKIRYNL